MRNAYGVMDSYGILSTFGISFNYGTQSSYGFGGGPSVLYSTLTSSASSFATNASVTITFTAKDVNNVVVAGYVPVPEAGVV